MMYKIFYLVKKQTNQVSCSTSKLHFLCGRDAHPTITLSKFDYVV